MSQFASSPASDDRHDSDYDVAWKEAIRLHLREFIEHCFPKIAVLIDWARTLQWLDNEISQVIGQLGQQNCEVDLLFFRSGVLMERTADSTESYAHNVDNALGLMSMRC